MYVSDTGLCLCRNRCSLQLHSYTTASEPTPQQLKILGSISWPSIAPLQQGSSGFDECRPERLQWSHKPQTQA